MIPKESQAWHQLYRSPAAITRRLATLPMRFEKLGINALPRSTQILDLCCGEGEALGLLSQMGFTHLSGVDLKISPALKANAKYELIEADAVRTGLNSESYDWVNCIHSLHHFGSAEGIQLLLSEATRLLRPGGRIALVDFHHSPVARIALQMLRLPVWKFPAYLNYLSLLVQEEWPYLSRYFKEWSAIEPILFNSDLRIVSHQRDLFYFYLVLQKPEWQKSNGKNPNSIRTDGYG